MTFDGRFFGFVVSIDHSEVNTATRHSIVHMLPEYSDVCVLIAFVLIHLLIHVMSSFFYFFPC